MGATSPGTLTSGAGGVAAYLDLGTGVGYGSRTYTTADQLQVLDVTLNASAVAALNGAAGHWHRQC